MSERWLHAVSLAVIISRRICPREREGKRGRERDSGARLTGERGRRSDSGREVETGWTRGVSSEKMADRSGKWRGESSTSIIAASRGPRKPKVARLSRKPRPPPKPREFRHRAREGMMLFLRSWYRGDRQHSFRYRAALPFSRSFLYSNATEYYNNLFNQVN